MTSVPGRGCSKVFQIERTVRIKKTGQQRTEVVEGVTSPTPEQASASDLLRYVVRQHWHIETKSHWIRDVTFDEDRSQVRGRKQSRRSWPPSAVPF